MSYGITCPKIIQTPNGISIPGYVYQDPNGLLAVPTTEFVMSSGGILIPKPVDSNNYPLIALAGSTVADAVLYNAANASVTGAGAVINVSGKNNLYLFVSGDATAAGSLNVYGGGTGTVFGQIQPTLLTTIGEATLPITTFPLLTIVAGVGETGAAIYQIPVAGMTFAYLPLTVSAGHITVEYGLM